MACTVRTRSQWCETKVLSKKVPTSGRNLKQGVLSRGQQRWVWIIRDINTVQDISKSSPQALQQHTEQEAVVQDHPKGLTISLDIRSTQKWHHIPNGRINYAYWMDCHWSEAESQFQQRWGKTSHMTPHFPPEADPGAHLLARHDVPLWAYMEPSDVCKEYSDRRQRKSLQSHDILSPPWEPNWCPAHCNTREVWWENSRQKQLRQQ